MKFWISKLKGKSNSKKATKFQQIIIKLACSMAGRTSFPLDSTQISMFYLIDPANVETVLVDQRLSDKVSFVIFYFKTIVNSISEP